MKKYIGLIIFGFILIFGVFCFCFFTLKDINQKSEELKLKIKENLFLEKKIERLKNFKKEYSQNKKEIEEMESLFLKEKPEDLIKFRQFLKKTALLSNVEFSILSFKKEKDYFLFQIAGKGDYSNIMRFLGKIENAPYLIKISKCFLKAKLQKESPFPKIEMNLTIEVLKK